VNRRTSLVSNRQSTKAMEPRERPFDDPAGPAEAATVRRPALGELAGDAALRQLIPMRLRIVPAVALNQRRFAHRPADTAAHGRHRVNQVEQFGDVIPVRGRQRRAERNPLAVSENMMLRPGLAAIGRVRSSFFPPRSARIEALSTIARARSSRPRRRSSASKAACRRFQTPRCCQYTSRRQQVTPDPQPISRGSIFHGMPLRRTNKIPVSTARSGIGFRPAWRRFRARRLGRIGSIRFHNSSSSSGSVMPDHLLVGQATVPRLSSKYKRVTAQF
jgi:hypothetical protein